MAMHKTNSILIYAVIPTIVIVLMLIFTSGSKQEKTSQESELISKELPIKNSAAHDSAAESLETLTAELTETKHKIVEVSKNNDALKKQNADLIGKLDSKQSEDSAQLSNELNEMKNQIHSLMNKKEEYAVNNGESIQPITTVTDVSSKSEIKEQGALSALGYSQKKTSISHAERTYSDEEGKPKVIPFYTIPANATSVKDHLMTALVGRIPIKGIVTDPYPFKIVISDDNLAANGLRVPHLLQMIVSGYCEGDLNLSSVRGWITSLTFVFDDGTITTTTSNDNDIGNFTKSNSLGYLSDKYGNPFIRGNIITNAPAYLGGNIALSMGAGAANAYSQSQTTTTTSFLGNNNTAVTGSAGKFVAGQALVGGANEAQQWWHDREQQSFDAIYVPPVDDKGNFIEIAVNFAKEIHIDYNPKGRKLSYAHHHNAHVRHSID